jgi:STE24 endopeptidase
MPSRPSARAALVAVAVVLGALWALAAVLLWRSRIPGDLVLPRLEEADFSSAADTSRAEAYERVVVWVLLGSVLAQIVALAVMAWRAPRTARGIGLGPIGTGVIVGLVTMIAVWAAGIPFTAVLTWWDHRHGLSDEGYLVAVIGPYAELFGLTVTALVTIVVVMWLARKLGRLWWLAGAPAFAAIATAFAFLLPYLLTLGTDRLAYPGLRAEIVRLEDATGAGATPVYVEEVSDYTPLPNAYAAGFGPSQRIVLWDTLLDGRFTDGEVAVVAAHELGHVARDHVWKGLAWFALLALPLLAAVSEVARLRGGLGLPENIPLAALALVAAGLCLAPVQNAISRHFEKEADWIALEATRDPAAMQTLFAKFSEETLSDPTPPAWTQALFGSHPSTLERIAMAEAWALDSAPTEEEP